MAKKAIIKDDQVVRFPASINMIKTLVPNTSLPRNPSLPLTVGGYTLLEPQDVAAPNAEFVREVQPEKIGETWFQKWDSRSLTAEEFEAKKRLKKEAVTAKRFENETGGVEVGGAEIATDREAQAMINGAYAFAQLNPAAMIDWKGADGWTTVDAATITAISQAVGGHIQACFSNERTLHDAIDAAADLAELDLIDIDGGWPE